MYRAITGGVEVVVSPEFAPDRSHPEQNNFFWTYTVHIRNLSETTFQLHARRWEITDGLGISQEVRGLGVVGQQPILKPGESYSYTSGCPLPTPQGVMVGSYEMLGEQGEKLEVAIPAFSLDSPYIKRVLH
jgi:ApaG protein